MKISSHLARLFVILAAALTATMVMAEQKPAATDSDDAIRKAVLETNAKMNKAANSLDADAFFSYILDTDKCVIIQNGVVFKNRQDALESVRQGFSAMEKIDRKFENPQVTILAPDTALLVSEGTLSATYSDGRTTDGRFAVSLVFVRRDGQWKVLHGHYSAPR